jgi:hypothetical protein
MAKQLGIVPLSGTIANITFTHGQDGLLAKLKSSLDRERIMTDDRFERTRENSKEFSRAGKGAKKLTDIFTVGIDNCYDNRLRGRLIGRLMKVIQSDTVSIRGSRNLVDGDDTLLNHFPWNRHTALKAVMKAPFTVTVDRAAGTSTVDIPAFRPDRLLKGNPDATHFEIIMSAAEVDWNAENQLANVAFTAMLAWDQTTTSPISQVLTVTAGSTLPIITTIAIRWYELVSGNYYLLKNAGYDTAGIVDVNTI